MKICTIQELLHAEVLTGEERLGDHVYSACGSDMMSDVLAYVKDQAVLHSGLVLMATDKRLYEACGILYANGLVGNKARRVQP